MRTTNKENKGIGRIRKADIILVGIILLIALFISVIFLFFINKEGKYVCIKVDGVIVEQLDLSKNQTIKINGYNGGENIVQINNGYVFMQESDCPDKLCVKMGGISRTGESIVCLPHRVVIEIENEIKDINEVDSIVR